MAGAVYWVGADGNIWFKSASGVQNMGRPYNAPGTNWDAGFDAERGSAEATRIADPNPPKQSTPAPAAPNGGGYSAPAKPDRSNDIALQNSGLNAVGQQETSGISQVEKTLRQLIGQYEEETGANEKNYTDQSNVNQNNYQKNKQTAYVNAAQGRQGLFGTLASLGALSGSGIDLANRAVQKTANTDLGGASDNYATNANQLDTAIGTFRREDKARRENANTAAENAKTNVRNEAAKSRLQFYTNLANDYSDMGNAGEAKRYTGLAGELYPQIASTNVPNAQIAYSGAAFTPGTLADYLAGANDTTVTATPTQPGQSVPGLVASPLKKKQLQPA